MKTAISSVHDYIAAQPEEAQRALRSVRSAIRTAVPKAEESLSYGMPAYLLHGERLLYFAGWKQHYSLYPATGRLIEAFKNDLGTGKIVKSTLRFSLAKPVPTKLIERIAKFRAKEITERKTS